MTTVSRWQEYALKKKIKEMQNWGGLYTPGKIRRCIWFLWKAAPMHRKDHLLLPAFYLWSRILRSCSPWCRSRSPSAHRWWHHMSALAVAATAGLCQCSLTACLPALSEREKKKKGRKEKGGEKEKWAGDSERAVKAQVGEKEAPPGTFPLWSQRVL